MRLMPRPDKGCEYILARFIYGPQYCGLLWHNRKVRIVKGESKVWLCKGHRRLLKRTS